MEEWAEVRRLVSVEKVSQREVVRRTGLARAQLRACVCRRSHRRNSSRPRVGSKLDPFRYWIVERLVANSKLTSQRLREMATEMGYEGGRDIFDTYVREVRPRVAPAGTFQRTIYRRRS